MAGFVVDPGALKGAADGVDDACAQVGDCGIDKWPPNSEHTGCGHLKSAVDDFCDRWKIGVGNLLGDGQAFAQALRDTATSYLRIDEGTASALRRIGSHE